MANAKVIYKKLGVGNYNNDTFRLAIIEGLLEGYEKPQKNILQTKWKHSFSIGGDILWAEILISPQVAERHTRIVRCVAIDL